jgi:hypothetical protein
MHISNFIRIVMIFPTLQLVTELMKSKSTKQAVKNLGKALKNKTFTFLVEAERVAHGQEERYPGIIVAKEMPAE